MTTEIITIGDEILIGQIVDTNSAWIADCLNMEGIPVKQISSISDNKEHIIKALNEASSRADLIIITGGLGPTNDDITKQTLCKYFGAKLIRNNSVLENINSIFSSRKFIINERNRQQADVPENCIVIPNSEGTAPGMWFKKNNKVYIAMPGVPFEMKKMMNNSVLKMIKNEFNYSGIFHKTILIQGYGESQLAEIISSWENNLPKDINLAYLPTPGLIRLRLTIHNNNKGSASEMLNNEVQKLQNIIPDAIVGYNDDSLEGVIGKILKERSLTIVTAESCTGGLISHKITAVPGSSDYYLGSVIAYSNEIKENQLKVKKSDLIKYGAVSKTVVESMAVGVRNIFNADVSIATSGIAGPGGGTDEKPVGCIWIAIATENEVYSQKFQFGTNRERNIIRTAYTAMNLLRKILLKNNNY